jgi:glutamine synthetase
VPRTLHEALDELEKSAFARRAFGDPVIDHLLHFAHTEQEVFDSRVSDVERERYFERI